MSGKVLHIFSVAAAIVIMKHELFITRDGMGFNNLNIISYL